MLNPEAPKFLKTEDFVAFASPDTTLVLGAKGSGKSALFEMFTKYEPEARRLAGKRLENVVLIGGTGFKDLKEINTADIGELRKQKDFTYDHLWEVYVLFKAVEAANRTGLKSTGQLKELFRALGMEPDYRLLPLLKAVYRWAIGTPPEKLELRIGGFELKIDKRTDADTRDLLLEVNSLFEKSGKELWILFDKIDELLSGEHDERKKAIEALFRVQMDLAPKYRNIRLKILLRTDIWATLNFTNKSHLVDKQRTLVWDKPRLIRMINKRALNSSEVVEYVRSQLPALRGKELNPESLSDDENEEIFYAIFAPTAYPGKREAELLDWILAHIKDAQDIPFPREFITFANLSRGEQLKLGAPKGAPLITGQAIRTAFPQLSDIRRKTYLAEFPDLSQHFERFGGKREAVFDRKALIEMMGGLDPSGDEMIKRLHDVGIIRPTDGGNISVAKKLEVPPLYRSGLGLVLRGRL